MKHLIRGWGRHCLAFALSVALLFSLATTAVALEPDELRTLLQKYYVDQSSVSEEVLGRSTVDDILTALDDPYTVYLTAEAYQDLLASMKDEQVVGIGISSIIDEAGLLIMGVYDGSPAQQAGIQVGDILTAVDGHAAAGQTAETITGWIRGEVGSQVAVDVLHPDGTTAHHTLTRQTVVVPSTSVEMLDGQIGYILCKVFGPETLQHFVDATTQHPEATHWIVDLRTNGGGDVVAMAQSLGVFLGKSKIAYLRNGQDEYLLYVSDQEEKTMNPAIVLTSPWTASASELFAAGIRDGDDGLLIGDKTFGKGIAQILLDESVEPNFFHGGDALRVTAYRNFNMSGSTPDKIGVIPHLYVPTTSSDEIALLLCAPQPSAANARFLRIHFGNWRWYVDLDQACSAEYVSFFTEFLEAIPPQVPLYQGNGNGGWNETTPQQVAAACNLTEYAPRTFSDAAGNQFETEINTLKTYGILLGDETGLYHPQETLTRAQLCALLVQALGLKGTGSQTFSDVPADAWYHDAVQAVSAAGLMDGVGDGTFRPDETLTHEQLIAVLGRVATRLNAYLYETYKEGVPDTNTVPAGYSEWAKSWVWLLSESQINVFGDPINLIYDVPSQLNPKDAPNRAQAAALMYQVLYYIGIIPVE